MTFREHDRKSLRLPNYDYSANGYYFVTICAKFRYPWFGTINNGKMILNTKGRIVSEQWNWLQQHYAYVDLDEFIIMPDHFHGIIVIRNDIIRDMGYHVGAGRDRPLQLIHRPLPITHQSVPTVQQSISSIHTSTTLHQQCKIKPLYQLIGAFKTRSSKYIRKNGYDTFQWQRNYYERIIRDELELNKKRRYIRNNPVNR